MIYHICRLSDQSYDNCRDQKCDQKCQHGYNNPRHPFSCSVINATLGNGIFYTGYTFFRQHFLKCSRQIDSCCLQSLLLTFYCIFCGSLYRCLHLIADSSRNSLIQPCMLLDKICHMRSSKAYQHNKNNN